MKIPLLFSHTIDSDEKENYEDSLVLVNLFRAKILAKIVIVFEGICLFSTIITAILKVDHRFAFDTYFIMYAIMISVNILFLFFTKSTNKKSELSKRQKILLNAVLIVYITFIMSWGSVISLLDQKLYGQLITFMINMIICSSVYLLAPKKIAIPYVTSILILVIGLPFFQFSRDILIGHYVNLFFFICVSWITSRIIYFNHYENYISKVLLNQSNLLLENEIEENKKINIKLTRANNQLKELALLDELTGISNRRSFWEFIDKTFNADVKTPATISIIMVDIDYFKQFNDHYGHEEGDKALTLVASQINSMIETSCEIAVRWGGEEFIYAAFNKSQKKIEETANIIREKVSALKITHAESLAHPYITVSLGACTIHINERQEIKHAVKLADQALYLAKSSGRNCIRILNNLDVFQSAPKQVSN